MINLTQNEIVDLFIKKIKVNGSTKTGTYNKQDPTCFEETREVLWLEYGYTLSEPDEESDSFWRYPITESIRIKVQNITWGIEFSFETSVGRETAYWSHEPNTEGGEWVRVTDKFFKVMKDLLLSGTQKSPAELAKEIDDIPLKYC